MSSLWITYNVLFTVSYILLMPRFLLRMWRRGGYRRGFLQRLGVYPAAVRRKLNSRPRVWVHAVSVGEVGVALRFMNELRAKDPTQAFVLTTTTSTGHSVAESQIHEDDVLLYFLPDFPFVVNRVLDVIRPHALILTECELWPNLIRAATMRDIPVILINGRISESSYRGYLRLKVFFKRVTQCLDLCLVQTPLDGVHLEGLGVPGNRIHVLGTAKYDAAYADPGGSEQGQTLLREMGMDLSFTYIVGGSTWPGEERALLKAFKAIRPRHENLKLILVPRHAERRAEIEAEIRRQGLSYTKRSELPPGSAPPPCNTDVLLVDSTGELKHVYTVASAIFVGKSLTRHGGQNIIEPALMGKPIVVGPNMENFPVVAEDFEAANALIQISDETELEDAIERLLANKEEADAYGRRARELVLNKVGVVSRSTDLILEMLKFEATRQRGQDKPILRSRSS